MTPGEQSQRMEVNVATAVGEATENPSTTHVQLNRSIFGAWTILPKADHAHHHVRDTNAKKSHVGEHAAHIADP